MNTEIEETKALLMSTFYLRKVEMSLLFRDNNEEPEYPHIFWRVEYYNQYESNNDFKSIHKFDVDTLEEAIAHGILGTKSNLKYKTCEIPDKLKKHWKLYRIIVKESMRRKIKWDELRENKGASISYKIKLSSGKWVEDFSEGARDLETALCFVPKRYWQMSEGAVPFYWDYRNTNEEKPLVELYPIFKYDGHYFKSKYYFPDQKCVSGDSETYHNAYEGDNSIKIEVWDTKCFEKSIIHFDGTHLIYNDTIVELTYVERRKYLRPISEEDLKNLKKMFPGAQEYYGHMESRSLKNE